MRSANPGRTARPGYSPALLGRPAPEFQARIVRRAADHLEMQSVTPLDRKLRQHDAAAVGLHTQDIAFQGVDPLDFLLAGTAGETPRKRAVLLEAHGILRAATAGSGPGADDPLRRNRLGGCPGRRLGR